MYELPYVLGIPNAMFGAPTLMEPLRTFVQTGLANFVRTGSPNARGRTSWPVYTSAGDRHVALRATPSTGRGLSRPACDFWDLLVQLGRVLM